jgi:hypothetical protein
MQMITTKKTPLWGKIAVTALALLVLVMAVGRIAGFVWDYVICGVSFSLIAVFEGKPFGVFVDQYCYWLGVGVSPTHPIFVRILVAIVGLLPKLLLLFCDAPMVLGCVLLPVNLWLLSGKKIGNILSAVSVGLVALGFGARAAFLACAEGAKFMTILLQSVPHALTAMFGSLLTLATALGLVLFALVLFLPSLFGMRPKWLSVTAAAVGLGAIGLGGGTSLLSAVVTTMQQFEFGRYIVMTTVMPYVGHLPHAFSVSGLHAAVLVTYMLYAIVEQFPFLLGKKTH